jgi:CMP-N,N'-diacetyllegionaminic acid synthase
MKRSDVIALIPARGGSKSIPRKNLVELSGRPLIAWSIRQALDSKYISRPIVSTDDPEIAEVARAYGAEVPFLRPVEFARDDSPDIEAFRHLLSFLREAGEPQPDLIVHLRPTGPVRRVALIDEAIEKILADPEADSLRSVSWPALSPYKMWRLGTGGYLEPLLTVPGMIDSHSMPRQKLPETFWQNGYVDIVRSRTILEKTSMTGSRVIPFVVQEPIYEIDYADSLPIVEQALKDLAAGRVGEVSEPRHPV